MSGQRTRCIVVGMGGVSRVMLRELAHKDWYETAAVVDISEPVLAEARSLLKLEEQALFKTLETALEQTDADAVLINTPSELHYAQVKAALEAGLHVLVAKPITNDFEQAVELVEMAKARGRMLCVGQQWRFSRHYRAVKRFVDSGKLGSVEIINFLNAKPRHKALNLSTMKQPALYEMSCHHFDSLMSLISHQRPESITCDGFQPSWSVYNGPCMVNALIRFTGGLHVLYHGGFSSQADCYELRLEGSQGALRCRGTHMSNDTMDYEYAERGGSFSLSDLDSDIATKNPWSSFFDIWQAYLHGGSEPSFSGGNNLRVFALLSAGIDSVERGKPVEVANNPRYATAFAAPVTATGKQPSGVSRG